jgi:predicted DNA-binding transcriptional regulator AlpA
VSLSYFWLEGIMAVAKARSGSESAENSELLTIQEVAGRLTVSVGCIRAWRLRGEGPPAIRVGSALRWDPDEVDGWLDSRRESRLEAG